jgi:aspartyl protease family protein
MLQTMLKGVGSWLTFAACCIISVVYFDELKSGMAYALGIQMPDVTEQGEQPQRVAANRDIANRDGSRDAGRDTTEKSSSGGVELRAGRNGHFETTAEINGRPVEVLVDTGATLIAMTFEDAERAGIYVKDADFTQRSQTANGIAKFAPVMLERVTIGDITVRNVRASVAEPGRLHITLLGMTFLSKLSRTEMRNGTLVLYE